MSPFQIIALILTLAAGSAYVNKRFLKLPPTIGVMLMSLIAALVLIFADKIGLYPIDEKIRPLLQQINFSQTVLNGILSFLIFAGSLHVDLQGLRREKLPIILLATIGVFLSTIIIGVLLNFVSSWVGFPISFNICLLFGALISPTDPIAVIALLKYVHAPKHLEVTIAGESLFNDGIGLVLFIVLSEIMTSGGTPDWSSGIYLFFREVIGGLTFGVILGWLGFFLIRKIDDFTVEVLITLALVAGGYALATAIHTSGLLAIVMVGLVIGNPVKRLVMSEETRNSLDSFWEIIDQVLNSVLFLLIGFQVILLPFTKNLLVIAGLTIPIVLFARFSSVAITCFFLKIKNEMGKHSVKILSWGGLRGGISVALALSLPDSQYRNVIVVSTFAVVIFSVVVQGLTMPRLLRVSGLVRKL